MSSACAADMMSRSTKPVTLSHAKYQKIAEQNRKMEIDREESQKLIQQEKILHANMLSEDRIEERRF